MENNVDSLDDRTVKPRQGSGSLLAAARKKQKKTVEEIAEELNLSVTQIKTIELDQNEGLPEPTYVRGYIRSYAKLLGLDADTVLENYLNPNWQKNSSFDDMPKHIASGNEVKKSGFLSSKKIIVFIILLTLIFMLWFNGVFSNILTSFKSPEENLDLGNVSSQVLTPNQLPSSTVVQSINSNPVQQEQVELVEVGAEGQNNDDQNSIETLSPEEQNINGDVVQQNSNADEVLEQDTSEEAAPSQAHNLVLTFVETCWVDIRDNKDNRLAYKSFYAGEEFAVSHDQVLNVFLGNADGVKATYNGKEFDMSAYREGVYAKFSLGKN